MNQCTYFYQHRSNIFPSSQPHLLGVSDIHSSSICSQGISIIISRNFTAETAYMTDLGFFRALERGKKKCVFYVQTIRIRQSINLYRASDVCHLQQNKGHQMLCSPFVTSTLDVCHLKIEFNQGIKFWYYCIGHLSGEMVSELVSHSKG